jgi:hypothetical protein
VPLIFVGSQIFVGRLDNAPISGGFPIRRAVRLPSPHLDLLKLSEQFNEPGWDWLREIVLRTQTSSDGRLSPAEQFVEGTVSA